MKISWIYSLLASVLLFFSCANTNEKADTSIDIGFSQFIESYTSGVISRKATVQIVFNDDLLLDTTANLAQVMQLSPRVKGEVKWLDSRTIAFVPTEMMRAGATYELDLDLKALVKEIPKEYRQLKYKFSTIAPSFNLNDIDLRAYTSGDLKYRYLLGSITLADYAENKEVESIIEIKELGKRLAIEWEHSGTTHTFRVDSLVRTNESKPVKVLWNGSAIDCDKEGSEELELLPLDVFKVARVKVVRNPEQCLIIRFSDPLLSSQNLKGLVTINGFDDFRYHLVHDELRIYPTTFITGEHELYVSNAIRNINNQKLTQEVRQQVQFKEMPPEVRLIGKGTIMPSSPELIFPFEAVNLRAVDVSIIEILAQNVHQFFQENSYAGSSSLKQVGRLVAKKQLNLQVSSFAALKDWNIYHVDLAKLVKINPGSIYRIELSFNKSYSLYDRDEMPSIRAKTSEEQYQEKRNLENEMAEWNTPGWYSSYYYPSNYNWEERNDPTTDSYYTSNKFVSQNLFATNLGIIAKGGANNVMLFAVTNLKTAQPESGVTLKVYNYQRQLMETVQSGKDGLVRVNLKYQPFLLVAEKGNQRAYLRLDDGLSLSLSNFDVQGNVIQEGIKGYVYGERGVWRPGDKVYVSFILEDSSNKLPQDYPVIFELINPKGQVVSRQVKNSSLNGVYCFVAQTEPEAPTGNWVANIQVGAQTFSQRIKVETVKPNRLKVDLSFPKTPLKIENKVAKATLSSAWLHGGVAKELNADVKVRFSPSKTSFVGYNSYEFDDPTKTLSADEELVFNGMLNERGEAKFDLNLPQMHSAPGMVRASFTSRIFEKTGDFSINVASVLYAPYSSFVGIKMPASDDQWYKTDKSYPIRIITLDSEGRKVNRKNLEVSVYKVQWRWWWDSGNDNLARYVDDSYCEPVLKETISTSNGEASFPLTINYNDWEDCGRYLIYVKDPVSGHATGITAYFSADDYWGTDGAQGAATMLNFKANKEKYNVGDNVEITIPSAKQANALVSIENGTKVVDCFWVKTKEKNTTFSFKVTPEMAPNVYVSISLIQPHAQTENDAPIRLFGIIPILVENPATRLEPQIIVPAELEPERKYEIKIKEKNAKNMTYTLAVVDDGLLDLTNFTTPNPWEIFYSREALGVKTWDFYDEVIGAYGAKLERAFAVGGDGSNALSKGKKANRFQSVVSFIGPFELKAGATNTHQLLMPNYVGSVRVMVVASNSKQKAYGNASKSVKVKKPLMLLATLPRVLSLGEEVVLPVNVFAMDESVKKVEVSIKTNDMLVPMGANSKAVDFAAVGDKIVGFKLKVADKIGVGKVSVYAKCGNHTAHYDMEIDVRSPNLPITKIKDVVLEKGKTWDIKLDAPGILGTNEAKLEVSSLPAIDLSRRLDYLIQYPHGCIEQITSAAFPQLMLNKLIVLNASQTEEVQKHIRMVLNKYVNYQMSNGGFSYWQGNNSYASEWGTTYAGHFMLKAEEAGYSLPTGMKNKWLSYQQGKARNWNARNGDSSLNQAYRLYTLALAKQPEFGAMNRLKEENLDITTTWRLAAAYAVAGQKEIAEKLITGLSTSVKSYRELSNTFGSDTRDKAMIMETLLLLNKKVEAYALFKDIATTLSSNEWLSTQTTAYALLAASEYIKDELVKSKSWQASVKVGTENATEIISQQAIWQRNLKFDAKGQSLVRIENKSEGVLYARVISKGIPHLGDTISYQQNLKMDIHYTDLSGQAINPTKITQGTDFLAVITLQNPGQMGYYQEMALTALFPSGWEIINNRLNDQENSFKNSEFTYQDIRDDRVMTYFDLSTYESKTFRILLNAAYEGKYYLPAVQCEAMYDNRINATKAGRWVEVVK